MEVSLPSSPSGTGEMEQGGEEENAVVAAEVEGEVGSGMKEKSPEHMSNNVPSVGHELGDRQDGIGRDIQGHTTATDVGLDEEGKSHKECVGGVSGTVSAPQTRGRRRGRGRKRGGNRGKRRASGKALSDGAVEDVKPVAAAEPAELSSDVPGQVKPHATYNHDVPIVVVTIPNADTTTCTDAGPTPLTDDTVAENASVPDQKTVCVDRSTSPEIPLQNSQIIASSPEAVPDAGRGSGGLIKVGGGQGKARVGSEGRLLERIVSSLVERTVLHSGGRDAKRGGAKRKTLTAKKPLQKLSLVDGEEVGYHVTRWIVWGPSVIDPIA